MCLRVPDCVIDRVLAACNGTNMFCAVMRIRQPKRSDLHPFLIQTNIQNATTNVASNGVPVASETQRL
jgi:hypothetical protein